MLQYTKLSREFTAFRSENMRLYLRMLGFLRPSWHLVAGVIALSVFYVFFNSASLWLSATFIDLLFNPKTAATAVEQVGGGHGASINAQIKDVVASLLLRETKAETLKVVCLVLLFSFFAKNLLDYFKKLLIGLIELRVITDIRNKIYAHLHRLPMKYFDARRSGEFTSISTNDVGVINDMVRSSFEKVVMTPLEVFTLLTILFIISWQLTLYVLILVPLIAVLVVKIGASIRRKSRRIYAKIADVINHLQETVSAIRIVKAFAMEEKEIARFREENRKFFKLAFRQRKLGALSSPLNEVLGASVGIFLLWYGGSQVLQGQGLTAEDFIRFIVVMFSIFAPLKTLSGLNNTIQAGMAAGERVFDILDTKPEIFDKPGAVELHRFEKSIILRDVSFRYDNDLPLVLKNISLEVEKGEVVAFVGHSGAGKTTLVDLIPRFYDVTSGQILIDDRDIRDVKVHSLRRLMGIVTQEAILFNDTVRANIGYGLENVPDEIVIRAAQVANAWEFIQKMKKGLDTVIGERGVKLSGGERQRLSIARAVLKNPPILILDEATSALDSESERLVQDALNRLMAHRTVMVIAHRLSTVINADKIVALRHGEIVEMGTHAALMQQGGYYRQLYEIQFGNEKAAAALQAGVADK